MNPECTKEIVEHWNATQKDQKNHLMRLFLQEEGDFQTQQDWLLFLAESFGFADRRGVGEKADFLKHRK